MLTRRQGLTVFDETGDPDGIPVVLLPAFGIDRSMWRDQQQSLGSMGYCVITMDLPGLSVAAESAFSMTSAADAIADTLQHLRRPAHLVGISIGATLAVQVALDHPDVVASLLLSGGQACPGFAGRLEWWVARAIPEKLLVGEVPSAVKKSHPELAKKSVAMQMAIGKRRLVAALDAFSKVDLRPRLAQIHVPTLVVCGTKNRLSLRGSRAFVAGIPSARLDLITDVGHVWNLEAPDQFTQTVDDFIQSTSP
jgi:3-oxoadipate enol-lactonase